MKGWHSAACGELMVFEQAGWSLEANVQSQIDIHGAEESDGKEPSRGDC